MEVKGVEAAVVADLEGVGAVLETVGDLLGQVGEELLSQGAGPGCDGFGGR